MFLYLILFTKIHPLSYTSTSVNNIKVIKNTKSFNRMSEQSPKRKRNHIGGRLHSRFTIRYNNHACACLFIKSYFTKRKTRIPTQSTE